MDTAELDAYLRRLGAEQPAWPTVDVLRELHLRHLRTVPFENLSIHLGEEIVLEEKRLLDKVVGERRGGFCFELNGLFGALLAALGFDVTLLAARVYGDEERLGIPYDHLALRVRTVDGGDWLADVGFGTHCHYPLEFGGRGSRRIRAARSGWPRRTGRAGAGVRGPGRVPGRQAPVPAGGAAESARGLRGGRLVAQHLACSPISPGPSSAPGSPRTADASPSAVARSRSPRRRATGR